MERVSDDYIRAFVDLYGEMASIKGLRHVPDAVSLRHLLWDGAFRMFFLHSAAGELLAAHLDYVHGEKAFHLMSANGRAAREVNGATQYLMERVFEWMGQRGVRVYDMGRIGVGAGSANSVAEFKMRSGGKPVRYNGEWIYVREKWAEWLYALYLNAKIERF